MKIILHVGMPKAGSTALQRGLSGLREQLLDAGVLYPESPAIGAKQPLLIFGLTGKELPRILRNIYDDDLDEVGRDYATWLDNLNQTVNKVRPDTLILSDELLFTIDHEDGFVELAKRLRRLANVIEVVVYVRKPSDHYLSAVQQALKASHNVRALRPTAYRTVLERYADHVADEMHVVRYDRTAWPDGDILSHFLTTFAPNTAVSPGHQPQELNSSLSTEAMATLAAYRKQFWTNHNDRFTPDTRRLVRALHAADKRLGGDRSPTLHEHVRHALDHGSPDLLWLRDAHGIVFDGVDYSRLAASPVDVANMQQPGEVGDICPIDAERKSRLDLRAMRHLAEPPKR